MVGRAIDKLFLDICSRKDSLITGLVLDDAEVGDVTAVVLGALKVEEHQTAAVCHVVLNRHVVVEEVIVGLLVVAGLTGHDRLQVTLVVFWVDVLIAHKASHFTTIVVVQTDTVHNTMTSLTLCQGGT